MGYFNFLKELVMLQRAGGTDSRRMTGGESLTARIMLYCGDHPKKYVMTLQSAQQQVDQWINTTGVRYFSELTNMVILTEEVGELARIIARKYGDQSFKESDMAYDIGDEMADVLWVLLCLANQAGVDLQAALQKNFEKKSSRDASRHRNNDKLA
jgi:NTP pyrophosphatase (non-canonical NTP hydrolase)